MHPTVMKGEKQNITDASTWNRAEMMKKQQQQNDVSNGIKILQEKYFCR